LRIDTGAIKTACELDASLDPKKLSQDVQDEMMSLINAVYPESQ